MKQVLTLTPTKEMPTQAFLGDLIFSASLYNPASNKCGVVDGMNGVEESKERGKISYEQSRILKRTIG